MSVRVYGDAESAIAIFIGKTKVYIRENITQTEKAEDKMHGAYMWDETVYDKDEYIKMMSERNDELEAQVNDTNVQLTDAQLALCDTYEQNIVLEEELTNTQLALCDVYELLITE